MSSDDRPLDTLTTLQNVVASAARLAHDLLRDPLLPRLLDVFGRMPAEDRETVLAVLDREVDLRNLARENPGGVLAGTHVIRPNPNARLYLRMVDNDPPTSSSAEAVMRGTIHATRVIHQAFEGSDDVRRTWEPAIREGLRRLDPAERAALRQAHQRMLDLVDEVAGESPGD